MIVKHLGRVDYGTTFDAMRAFTASRTEHTPDELWLCEHTPPPSPKGWRAAPTTYWRPGISPWWPQTVAAK